MWLIYQTSWSSTKEGWLSSRSCHLKCRPKSIHKVMEWLSNKIFLSMITSLTFRVVWPNYRDHSPKIRTRQQSSTLETMSGHTRCLFLTKRSQSKTVRRNRRTVLIRLATYSPVFTQTSTTKPRKKRTNSHPSKKPETTSFAVCETWAAPATSWMAAMARYSRRTMLWMPRLSARIGSITSR